MRTKCPRSQVAARKIHICFFHRLITLVSGNIPLFRDTFICSPGFSIAVRMLKWVQKMVLDLWLY